MREYVNLENFDKKWVKLEIEKMTFQKEKICLIFETKQTIRWFSMAQWMHCGLRI